jgi:cation diffusion facilitator CzcD-associated flavoprotein CzcO
MSEVETDVDVAVIGAGFAGIYMLHKLRELGIKARVLEAGDGVGGTWYWNRYPGCRVDVQSIEYQFTFSKEIDQEYEWSELNAPQPQVEAYLNHVTDRLDLRRDMRFATRVTALTFDESSATWTIETETGERLVSHFVVAATGCLSAPLEPDIKGLQTFEGTSLYTNRFPEGGYDFTGKRVAVIGTGSSGVQCVPVIAEAAEHLYVFQRSAAYTVPSRTRPFEPGELDELKKGFDEMREKMRASAIGIVGRGVLTGITGRKILETPMKERLAMLDELGLRAILEFDDVMRDFEASRAATELYAEMVKRIVKDPETANSLIPHYPFGCKRLISDRDYFVTYNRPNVTLVDLLKGGISEITPGGIATEQGFFDLDVIVYATGFDAVTGSLSRIDVRGRHGQSLADVWKSEGPVSYLGLQVAGFPNLFTITGPGSPSVLSNMVISIEDHVEWIADCITYLGKNGFRHIEANPLAQHEWVVHTASLANGTIRAAESCSSWYLGANIPGKPRVFMPYLGGLPQYRQKCDAVAESGYEGFEIE